MQVIKITRPGAGYYYTDDRDVAMSELSQFWAEDEPGDEIFFTLEEMNSDVYDALPEFKGW